MPIPLSLAYQVTMVIVVGCVEGGWLQVLILGGDKITSNIINIVKEGLDKGHQIYAYKEYSETRVMYAEKKEEGGGEKRTEEERFLNALRADEERRERFRDESGRSVEDNEVYRHNWFAWVYM